MNDHKKKFTNENAAKSFLQKNKRILDIKTTAAAITNGDKVAISQTITLIESQNEINWQRGHAILEELPRPETTAKCIGITGSPGVGKSSFIEQLGLMLVEQNLKIAVLAIDPSSQVSKGSILGDKTRMEILSNHPLAFIRPSAAGKTLGGVARTTKSAIELCEKAGYDVILVETVGVGQSEVLVHAMTDMMLLLLQPGSGDELQGIKKGVVELADLLVVNKYDTDKKDLAKQTQRFFSNAVHMLSPLHNDWQVKVLLSSAIEKTGLEEIWKSITSFFNTKETNGQLLSRRMQQSALWYDSYMEKIILSTILENEEINATISVNRKKIESGEFTLFQAVEQLKNLLNQRLNDK